MCLKIRTCRKICHDIYLREVDGLARQVPMFSRWARVQCKGAQGGQFMDPDAIRLSAMNAWLHFRWTMQLDCPSWPPSLLPKIAMSPLPHSTSTCLLANYARSSTYTSPSFYFDTCWFSYIIFIVWSNSILYQRIFLIL